MILHAHGRSGMGDVMMYLNLAHTKAYIYNTQVTLYMHWPWSEDYEYHFEDPESIDERMDYIHNFYLNKDSVKVIHLFNTHEPLLEEYRVVTDEQLKTNHVKEGEGLMNDAQGCSRHWMFDRHLDATPIKKKIVLWRPTFNREEPNLWKLVFEDRLWNRCIERFTEMGYNVVEISYRTPIREALYHCKTAEMAFFYDGMWHFITTMLFKPTIVVGNTGIVLTNTFNGIPIRTPNEMLTLLDDWDVRKFWDKSKRNPKKPGTTYRLPRYSTPIKMTGREYIIWYNNRMKNKFHIIYNMKIDWSARPCILSERRNPNDKDRSRSNRGKRRM